MTSAEFLEWEAGQDGKHEFCRGEVFAMADGTEPHATVITNCLVLLDAAVRPRGCRVFTDALWVRIDAVDLYTCPDLSVVCGDAQFADARRTTLLNPVVIAEVLSPSMAEYDRTVKWSFYARLPSLKAYVLISQDSPAVDVYSRNGDGWRVVHADAGEARIPCLDVALDLEALYDGVAFPGPGERTRPTPGV